MSKPTPAMMKVLREAKFSATSSSATARFTADDVKHRSVAKRRSMLWSRGWLQRWRSSFAITTMGKFAEHDLSG